MKIVEGARWNTREFVEQYQKEIDVHQEAADFPFLVQLFFIIHEQSLLYILMGEYIKYIPDSKTYEKLSKKYNDIKCRTVGWERAVTGTEHIHSNFIILNRHIYIYIYIHYSKECLYTGTLADKSVLHYISSFPVIRLILLQSRVNPPLRQKTVCMCVCMCGEGSR
jgi:hypothetical protein